MPPLSAFSRFALAVGVVLAALLAYAVGGIRSPSASHLASNVCQAAILIWASASATVVARRSAGHLRQLWRLFAASLWVLAAGQVMVSYLSSVSRAPAATPWPSDVLIFIWVVPAAMMLLPYRGSRDRSLDWQHTLDFLQAGIVALTAYLYFFYVPSLWELEGLSMFRRLMWGMVARDILLAIGFGVRTILTRPFAARGFFTRIFLFFVSVGVFEFLSIAQLGQSGRAAEWVGASWCIPYLFAGVIAATWNTRQPTEQELPRAKRGGWIASQVFPVAIPILVIVMGHRIALEQLTIAWIAVGASFACSAARLVITSEQQHRIAETLGRTEQALRSSESMFSSAFRASPDAISIARIPEGIIQEINDGFVRLTGYPRDQVIGKSPEGIGLWVDEESMVALRARFRETGEIREAELRFRRKDGEIRYGLLSGSIIELNERRYSLIVVRDVTESKQAEQLLRSSEERFRSLVQTLRVGVSTWTPDGRCQFINQALVELFGAPLDRVLGKTSAEILPACYLDGTEIPPHMRPAARAMETGRPVRNQVMGWRVPSSPDLLWTLVDAVPEFGADGHVVGAIASMTNITDLKRAEEQTRISQEIFSKAFHSSPDSMSISTLDDGRYIEVNEGFTRLLGWGREEAIGKTVGELGIWEDMASRQEFKNRLAKHGRTMQFETTLSVKTGETRSVQVSADLITLDGRTCILSIAHDITDRKKREAELRASEQRSRTLLEAMRVGVSTWGADGICRSANWALQEMTGMAEDQFVGKTGAQLGPAFGEDGKEVPGHLRPAAVAKATRAPVRKQVLGLKLPSKEDLLWVLADAVPEFTPEGEFKGIIASYTEITDLKRAEEQIRISQEMFSKAFHASPDSMTISTLMDGRYVEVNEGYTRLFGWRREEVIGKTTTELGIWPDPADREILKRALLDQGRVRELEFKIRIKTGQLRTILISGDVIELNRQACFLAVTDDITEWKQAQEALRFSEDRFRSLVQTLDVAVLLMGADERVQFANPAALRMLGLKFDHIVGKNSGDLGLTVISEDGTPVPDSARPAIQVLRTGQPIRNTVIGFQRPNIEEVLWVFGNVAPLFAEDGKVTAVVASFADITEQKKAGEAMRQLSGRLLQLQDEERRRLGRDLHDSLAQSVLAVNLSLAQVTKSAKTLDERNRRSLAEARSLLQDMSRQIRSLSYLLHPPLLDELGLASAVKEYALGFSERSGIQIQVGISPGFGRLSQDAETALFRIIQESLANIQRHSGSPTARIQLRGVSDGITLEVSDQGRGIPAGSGRKLAQAGARLGVGIAGMRERMAQLGGTLEIESNGTGTTVRATLPVKAEVQDAASRSRGG